MMHKRWSHGSYGGLKWVSMSYPGGRLRSAILRSRRLPNRGVLRAMNQTSPPKKELRHRMSEGATRRGNTLRTAMAVGSILGADVKYDGVRCSIVTWAAF